MIRLSRATAGERRRPGNYVVQRRLIDEGEQRPLEPNREPSIHRVVRLNITGEGYKCAFNRARVVEIRGPEQMESDHPVHKKQNGRSKRVRHALRK